MRPVSMRESDDRRPALDDPAADEDTGTEAEARTLVLVLRGTITRDDVPRLCAYLRRQLRRRVSGQAPTQAHGAVRAQARGAGPVRVTVDVAGVTHPDVVTLEALARLQLTAVRLGHRILLLHADADLRGLLARSGLDGVLPLLDG